MDAVGDLAAAAAEAHRRTLPPSLGGDGRSHRHGGCGDGGLLGGPHRDSTGDIDIRIEDAGPQGGAISLAADGIANDRHTDRHPHRRTIATSGNRHGGG